MVFVGDGRGVDALKPFSKAVRNSRARPRAIATNMNPAYIHSVRENVLAAAHGFDYFPVIKLFNDQLSALRRELYHEAASDRERKVLKGTR